MTDTVLPNRCTGADFTDLAVGDRVAFTPGGSRQWWTVRARDDRYLVATLPAPFQPAGEYWYTIVDLTGWLERRYNGAGHGVVRSSLNTLGGGWPGIEPGGSGCDEILATLNDPDSHWELSHRRILNVHQIRTRKATPA